MKIPAKKICTKCKQEKDMSEFNSRGEKDYVRSDCKECCKAYGKKYREKTLEKQRARYTKYDSEHRKERAESALAHYHAVAKYNVANQLLKHARQRAKQQKLPFNLILEDIVVPEVCPILGIPLTTGEGKFHSGSPTIDKIIPSLGYTKENIAVISHKANTIKQDVSSEILFNVANWLKLQEERLRDGSKI